MSNNLASFAPYTPPPDHPEYTPTPAPIRPWFPAHVSSSHEINTSYQSGGIPTFANSASGGGGNTSDTQQNQWETRYGLRIDILAALAYLLGPISALTLLIIETQNDYVRFHAYQSALLTTPLLVLRIFASLVGAPSWLRTLCTMLLILPPLFMAVRAYVDVSRAGLLHYHLPVIGPIADNWLAEE